jgi:hypothetical protein
MPDGSIVRTALSPVAAVTVTAQKIEWSVITHSTFLGATTVAAELFRATAAMAELYLVTTLASGTTTYSDNVSDATLITGTAYAETGYYPPPPNANLVRYHSNADRLFCTVDGDAYWSEAGLYHIFKYSATTSAYINVNSVFLGKEKITAVKLLDENLYFGSLRTWRRLRGKAPAEWAWEDTGAICGPINNDSACETPFGVPYPGIDGRLWVFNGLTSEPTLEEYVFPSSPTAAAAHAVYDGRSYRLFYGDTTYPSVVVDFLRYPKSPAVLVQCTTGATASFYDRDTATLYLASATHVKKNNNTTASVAVAIRTGEVPPEDLAHLGNMGAMVIRVNTLGDSLTITPILNGVAQSALAAVITSSLLFKEVPIRFGDCYALSFDLAITSAKAIEIHEPIILRRE